MCRWLPSPEAGEVEAAELLRRATTAGWARVLDGYPSTHILKPVSAEHPTVIFEEEYGSRFARAAGLAEFATSIETFAGTPALLIERYDRVDGERVHQEDLGQALGLIGNEKYQRHGGRVAPADGR